MQAKYKQNASTIAIKLQLKCEQQKHTDGLTRTKDQYQVKRSKGRTMRDLGFTVSRSRVW
jgi:hypothetical protein